jgi:lipid-A-disaccharide synthase
MWFARVLVNLHRFWNLASRADRYFRHYRPDAVVLIDYPGFNWWIARRAKAHRIPVFYYGTPQLWAWAGWRVKKMRRFVDHVLCKLPFEVAWYRERGCHATYVGHPYFDQLRAEQLDAVFIERQKSVGGRLVAILPGSRTQEVESNLATFLKAARLIRERVPDARFAVAAFKPAHAARARAAVSGTGLPIEIHVGRTAELISVAECALAVSGSVSLELLFHTTPTVILYKISRAAFFVQRFFRKVRYITLVNLLVAEDLFPRRVATYDPANPIDAGVLMPEYLTYEDKSGQLAAHAVQWLTDAAERERIVGEMLKLKEVVGHGGASQRAAEYMMKELSSCRLRELRTHQEFRAKPQAAARDAA